MMGDDQKGRFNSTNEPGTMMMARMPSSSKLIEDALKNSIKKSNNLDANIQATVKRLLKHRVEFVEAQGTKTPVDHLKKKYVSMNPQGADSAGDRKPDVEEEVKSKVITFPHISVPVEWLGTRTFATGMDNMGNTCFLNAVIQILTFTPPLVNYINSGQHKCHHTAFCMMCELITHYKRCVNSPQRSIRPFNIVNRLRDIGRTFRQGRQEDAHEFLRYVIMALQTSCKISPKAGGPNKFNNRITSKDTSNKETNVINQIFAGKLRSQVVCTKCFTRSYTFESFMDLSLEIKNSNSISKCLQHFTRTEILSNDNAYYCNACKVKVVAKKRFSIHTPPNILTLQLKRFSGKTLFGKLLRDIEVHDKLNIRPYMSLRSGVPVNYRLYGILIHGGYTLECGHYYCMAKGADKYWYQLDDSSVNKISLEHVLRSQSYLVFYKRELPEVNGAPAAKDIKVSPLCTVPTVSPSKQNIGPKFISELSSNGKSKNITMLSGLKKILKNMESLNTKPEPKKQVPSSVSNSSSSVSSQRSTSDADQKRSRDLSFSCTTSRSSSSAFSSASSSSPDEPATEPISPPEDEVKINRLKKKREFARTLSMEEKRDIPNCNNSNNSTTYAPPSKISSSPVKSPMKSLMNSIKSPMKSMNSPMNSPIKSFGKFASKSPVKTCSKSAGKQPLVKCADEPEKKKFQMKPVATSSEDDASKIYSSTPEISSSNGSVPTESRKTIRNRNKRRNRRNKKEAERLAQQADLDGVKEEVIVRKRKREDKPAEEIINKKKIKNCWTNNKTNKPIDITPTLNQGSHHKQFSNTILRKQDWDMHFQKEPKVEKKTPEVWDGTQKKGNNFAVRDLLHGNRSFGTMGNNVEAWDGGVNENDRSLVRERQQIIKDNRAWEKTYDQDIDSGKVKKYKKPPNDSNKGSLNHFQILHEKKKKIKNQE